MIKAKQIYVLCPANVRTGGPELLHQLVYTLNQNGSSAHIVYYGIQNHDYKILADYAKYADSYLLVTEIEDCAENLIVAPETQVLILKSFKNIQKAIWWLSVDNFFFAHKNFQSILYRWKNARFPKALRVARQFLRMRNQSWISPKSKYLKNIPFHLCQSFYAMDFCKKHDLNALYLSDYINDDFLVSVKLCSQKENIVAYNPKKGYAFTKKIIKQNPDIQFVPIENMTRTEVLELLQRAKVYIDFGNHPGMDRIPREAKMQGCVVITGMKGSAGFYDDVPIKEKFADKPRNIPAIAKLIRDVFADYETYNQKQEEYSNFIRGQKKAFEQDILRIFDLTNSRG